MMNSDHLIESSDPPQQHTPSSSGLHHRDVRGDASSSDGHATLPIPHPTNGGANNNVNVGMLGSSPLSPTTPRKRFVRSSSGDGGDGDVRIDVDDKNRKAQGGRAGRGHVNYGKRRRKKGNVDNAVLGAMICVVSFVVGFAWMHFARDESSRTAPRLRRASESELGRWRPRDRPVEKQQQRQQPDDKRQPAKRAGNSLLIPRFDARRFVKTWEKNARNAALQQAGGALPQSIHLEGWNVPVAFRSFPYARQTHGPIKNLDSDYGGLTYHSVKNREVFARTIPEDDDDEAVPGAFDPDTIYPDDDLRKRNKRRKGQGRYPNVDTDGKRILRKHGASYEEVKTYYDDDNVHVLPKANDGKTRKPRACRKQELSQMYFPNCNAFHEHDLGRPFDDPALFEHPRPENEMYRKYLAHGYYRDVWIMEDGPWIWPDRYPKEKDGVTIKYGVEDEKRTAEMVAKAYRSTALKTLQMKHPYTDEHLEEVQNEAIIMERLTSSPRIMDIYGHCVFSTMAEVVPIEFEEVVVPGEGYHSKETVENRNAGGVRPYNDFTPTEKLGFALEMAESLADLHGFPDGVIVHDDVQPCQWLRTPDGHLKLGDFNRATIMQWDDLAGGYCKFNNGEAFANYRAPEEFAVRNLDEQIDVFSFGNNLYGMLTGLWNFYDTDDDGVVQKKLIDGGVAYIDPRYRERSFGERKLVELVEKCWVYDPGERISIFEAVNFLRDAIEENEKEENKKGNEETARVAGKER